MVQFLEHREVPFSNISNPVKDFLKETAWNPGFKQMSNLEQRKDLKVSSAFEISPKYLLL